MPNKKHKSEFSEIQGQDAQVAKPIPDYETEALNLVLRRFKEADAVHDTLMPKWKDWQDAAKSYLRTSIEENLKYKSRVFVPVTETAVRALLAKYIVAMFIKKPFFDLRGRMPDDDGKAERLKLMLSYMFDKMPDFTINMIRFVQELLVYGTAFAKVYWKRDEKLTKVHGKKKSIINYEGSYFEPMHIENFFFDPQATKLNGFWKLHRSFKTLYELEKVNKQAIELGGEAIYKNLDRISVINLPDKGDTLISESKRIRGEFTISDTPNEYKTVEVWEYWAEDDSRVITVANRSVVIRDVPNPFESGEHPFVCAVYEPTMFELYGRGICEKLKPYQDTLNSIHNQIIDNTRLITNKQILAEVGSISGNTLSDRPGKIHFVENIQAVKELNITPIPEQVYRLYDRMVAKMEEEAGMGQLVTSVGTPITKEMSATEGAMINRLGNEFHGLNLMLLEVPGLLEVVRKSYRLCQQYITESLAVRVIGEDKWEIVNEEDLEMDVDIIPKVGIDVMSKEVIQSNLVQLIAAIKDVAGYDIHKMVDMFIANLGYHPEQFKAEMGFAPPALPPAAPGTAPTEPSGVGAIPPGLGTPAEGVA